MKFVFICEYNKEVGLGHFDRCLNLANFLDKQKYECSFITFNSQKKLINTFVINKNYNFFDMSKNLLTIKKIDKFLEYILKHNPDFVVFDSYKINYNFYKKLSEHNVKTIVFADFKDKKYFCDILINPNSDRNFENKKKHSFTLSGLNYQFTNKLFFKKKRGNIKSNSILIYLGSIKNINFIFKIIKKINKFFDNQLTFKIISSKKLYIFNKDVRQINFLETKNLIKEIDKSKFIISAGGTFLTKSVIKNKVVVAVKTANNQNELINYLIKENKIFFLKKNSLNFKKKLFFEKIKLLKKTKSLNIEKNNKSKFNYFLKTLKVIYQNRIFLEKKEKKHGNEILKIQNEKNSRLFANIQKKIKPMEHKKWFNGMLKNKFYYHYLIKRNLSTVGLLSYKPFKDYYLLSIIIKEKYKKNNYAYRAIKNSLNFEYLIGKKIIAEVKKNNFASIKLFKKLNFSLNKKSKLFMKVI